MSHLTVHDPATRTTVAYLDSDTQVGVFPSNGREPYVGDIAGLADILSDRDRLRDLLSRVAGSSYMVTSLPGRGPTIELYVDAALWAEINEAVAS